MTARNLLTIATRRLALPAAIAASAMVAVPVQASPLAASLSIVTAQIMRTNCAVSPAIASAEDLAGISKQQAILGGAPSALERIQQRQSGTPVEEIALAEPVATAPDPVCEAYRLAMPRVDRKAVMIQPAVTASAAQGADSDNFLATSRVRIGKTSFDRQWERVSHAKLSPMQVQSLVGGADADRTALVQSVNRWVNHRIVFTNDRDLWAVGDYWAAADQTLASGRGDCEDIAILKYQMLLSLGVDRKDMYLTLARDLARNADHAVLVVKMGSGFALLDNATDTVLPADRAYDYRPTMSFGADSAWLHGAVIARRETQLALGESDVQSAGDRL